MNKYWFLMSDPGNHSKHDNNQALQVLIHIVTAFNAKDSLGNTTSRAKFDDGTQSFSSDTIQFNMKSQQGLTKNTYTQPQGELNVHADLIKKVNDQVTFAKRLTMTTCEYDHPHFGFVASKGKFVNEKIAVTGPVSRVGPPENPRWLHGPADEWLC